MVHSKKIVDVKSRYCKECEIRAKKKGTEEYREWKIEHQSQLNHEGLARKIEVYSIKEIFHRSQEQYRVKYITLVTAIRRRTKVFVYYIESQLYGNTVEIGKKECIEHVQKRVLDSESAKRSQRHFDEISSHWKKCEVRCGPLFIIIVRQKTNRNIIFVLKSRIHGASSNEQKRTGRWTDMSKITILYQMF